MQRVVILGRGGAGKSRLARQLGSLTGLPVIELDPRFWQPGLIATPHDRWVEVQRELGAPDRYQRCGLLLYITVAYRIINLVSSNLAPG